MVKKPSVRRRRRRKNPANKNVDSEEHEELKKTVFTLSRKIDSGKRKHSEEPDQPPIMRKKTSADVFSVHNPSSYNRLVNRLDETQANKVPKPDGKFLESPWICGLCGCEPYDRSSGPLFGPYYQALDPGAFWPPFLSESKSRHSSPEKRRTKTSGKSSSNEVLASGSRKNSMYTDLWFHGECLCWASGLLLKGCHITGLEEHIPDYWKQSCTYCGKWGASIGCEKKGCSKIYHFSCGKEKGCLLQEQSFSSLCASHRGKSNLFLKE